VGGSVRKTCRIEGDVGKRLKKKKGTRSWGSGNWGRPEGT